MPKVNHQPDSDRRQTRAANANAHPGRVVKDVLGGRRKQEDIEKDKEAKKERRETRERKKVEKRVAIGAIAEFENRMALDDEIQGTKFPRRQSEGKPSDSFVIYILHTMHLQSMFRQSQRSTRNVKLGQKIYPVLAVISWLSATPTRNVQTLTRGSLNSTRGLTQVTTVIRLWPKN